ncbi:MAG: biotin/lipoyl-containing protein, partial [Alphaproteobacteria bacterium]
MTVDIKVPALGESVTEATIAKWLKAVGDAVGQDEPLVELETDKVTVEVPAAQAGVLQEIVADEGTTVEVGSLLGRLGDGAASAAAGDSKPAGAVPNGDASVAPTRSKPAAAATDGAKDRPAEAKAAQPAAPSGSPADLPLAPS